MRSTPLQSAFGIQILILLSSVFISFSAAAPGVLPLGHLKGKHQAVSDPSGASSTGLQAAVDTATTGAHPIELVSKLGSALSDADCLQLHVEIETDPNLQEDPNIQETAWILLQEKRRRFDGSCEVVPAATLGATLTR
ncbi:hypothetical protein BJ508DRAFT_335440 [Ascobolus immersus RN42]|uniref:Uncharacterized protein n=1 Tax=Ascobolus immersus RN42 TaxID=1160509 RepID=A0A3N4HFW3_ASCIM|nr:hypothetical protein BJ508DRAFT_335440 [Ascobolus immersus RN42]